jgi:hypothetical protein
VPVQRTDPDLVFAYRFNHRHLPRVRWR